MNAHFKEVDNFIVHFGFGKQPLEWHTVAYIEGRFRLTYVQPVIVDYPARTVSPAGEPAFVLWAAEVIQFKNGLPSTSFDGNLQREFGKAEWEKFVHSGFDLRSLGIPAPEIHAVPLWNEYVQAWRKDMVRIE